MKWTSGVLAAVAAFIGGYSAGAVTRPAFGASLTVPSHMKANLERISIRLDSGQIRPLGLNQWYCRILGYNKGGISDPISHEKIEQLTVGFENLQKAQGENWIDLSLNLAYASGGHWGTGQKWWLFIFGTGGMKMDILIDGKKECTYQGEEVLEKVDSFVSRGVKLVLP